MPLISESEEPEPRDPKGYWMGYDIGVIHGRTDMLRRVVEGLTFERFDLPSSDEEGRVYAAKVDDLERYYQRLALRSATCWAELLAD